MIQISIYLTSCLLLGLAILVWRARPASATNRLFSVFTLLIAIWTFSIASMLSGGNLFFASRLSFAAASLIPATFLAFVYYYPTPSKWPGRTGLVLTFATALILVVVSLTTRLVVSGARMTSAGLTRETGPFYPVFAAYFLLTWLFALVVILAKWRRARGRARVQLHYLVLGAVTSSAGAITTNLLVPLATGRTMYVSIGPYFALVLVAMVAHAIIRHRLMDVRLVIHRGLTFAVALVLSLIPVAALLALAWPRLSAHLAFDELVTLILAVIAVGVLIPLTRDVTGRLLDRYVYRTHVNYQRTLRTASETLTGVLDLGVLLPILNQTVGTSTNAEGTSVYLRTSSFRAGAVFRRANTHKPEPPTSFETPDETPEEIATALINMKDLLLTDELGRERLTPGRERLHQELTRLNWALVLPLISEATVIGAIVVGPKLSGDPFYPQDLDLLMTLANQAGVAVKNAQLYAQVLLANEYLNDIVSQTESGAA